MSYILQTELTVILYIYYIYLLHFIFKTQRYFLLGSCLNIQFISLCFNPRHNFCLQFTRSKVIKKKAQEYLRWQRMNGSYRLSP